MDKLTLAHEWALVFTQHNKDLSVAAKTVSAWAFEYADAMQAEADKRNKAEAEKKRKEMREMLNAPNTFVERIGQHFDDVEEWQPDWSQAPDGYNYWVATADHSGKISGGWFYDVEPEIGESDGVSIYYSNNSNPILTDSFNYQGNWQNSLRKRPEALFEVDWRVAPEWAVAWTIDSGEILWWSYKPELKNGYWFVEDLVVWQCAEAPSFGFTGTHIVERPHGF